MYIKPDYVIDNIYIGSDQSANNYDKMKELGITHVIVVGSELSCRFPKHFKYMHVCMYDTEDENLLRYLDITTDYMKSIYDSDKINKILVHCSAGISRSASIVIAYLLRYTFMNHYDDAFMFLREIRPIIDPNSNFVKQLKVFSYKYNLVNTRTLMKWCDRI
jgi:protein-tyrosine phosphatase